MKTGIELIAEERQRQIEKEGWTPEHDAEHTNNELALAAICYTAPEFVRKSGRWYDINLWPWSQSYWKPTPKNRIRELTKAGALIAAEIDRLQANPLTNTEK